MNNLINKAIKAIQDGKTEYAIGLLEGILEMNGINSEIALGGQKNKPNIPQAYRTPEVEVSVAEYNSSIDEGVALDIAAAAKLETIKNMANQGIE